VSKFTDLLNLDQNELQNAVVHKLSSPPEGPLEGQFYYSDINKLLYYFDGVEWLAFEPQKKPIKTVTTTYSVSLLDSILLADATSGSFTITLPLSSGYVGRVFNIKKIDNTSGKITVQRSGSDLIDGKTTQVLGNRWVSITTVSDGSAWYLI
jgi:hypothetical protein